MMKSLLNILLLAVAMAAAPHGLAAEFDIRELLGQVEGVEIADSKDRRQLMIAQSNGPTLSEAVEMVKRQYNGRIVDAWTTTNGDREVHHIKVLTDDGKVKTVRIPGRRRQQ